MVQVIPLALVVVVASSWPTSWLARHVNMMETSGEQGWDASDRFCDHGTDLSRFQSRLVRKLHFFIAPPCLPAKRDPKHGNRKPYLYCTLGGKTHIQ